MTLNLRGGLVFAANILLLITYLAGGIAITYPSFFSNTPLAEFSRISVGILLLATALFGSPYFTDYSEDDELT